MAFETLRQVVIEPDHRVWIGIAPPPEPIATEIIRTLKVNRAQVYMAKMRVSRLVRAEMAALEAAEK